MDNLPEGVAETRWITGSPTFKQVTDDIARPMEGRPGVIKPVLKFQIACS